MWPILESIPGPLACWTVWRDKLGRDYESFKAAFLKPAPESPLKFVPCFMGCRCEHEVQLQPNGVMLGICRCGACSTFTVRPEDVIPLELDCSRLARALSTTLSLKHKPARARPYNTFQAGLFGTLPVFLTIQISSGEFLHAATALVTEVNRPFILLVPTGQHVTPAARQLLAGIGAACFPLSGNVGFDSKSGELSLLNSQFTAAFTELIPALDTKPTSDEDATFRAFELIEQLEAGDRSKPPTVLTVFRLYCISELSIPQIARKCRCSIATVANRLKLIREKTGREPLDLRQFAARFSTLNRDRAFSKRNYSRRHRNPFNSFYEP